MAILFGSLLAAINWEISKLNLQFTVLQLFLLLSIGGGIVLTAVFCRVTARMPRAQQGRVRITTRPYLFPETKRGLRSNTRSGAALEEQSVFFDGTYRQRPEDAVRKEETRGTSRLRL